MIVFGLDYDNTYTEDPELFNAFIAHAKSRGHIVVCVTSRMQDGEAVVPGIETFYTAGEPKAEFMKDHLTIDVWIDDWPENIGSTRP